MDEALLSASANRSRLIPWVLAAVVLAVFGRTATHDFVTWDDEKLIYRLNPDLNPPTLKGLDHLWRAPQDLMYIPLVYSAWWGLADLGWLNVPDAETGSHINAAPFHVANLLFHFLSVLAVYRILKALFERPWAACAGALVFAVHPTQVEPVAWATGLKDVMSGALGLWAIFYYLDPSTLPAGDRRWTRRYAMATVLFLLALLAKPSMVTVPLIAMALVRFKTGRSWKVVVPPLIPWLIAGFFATLIAGYVQPASDVNTGPLWARPLIAADALAFYLFKLILPIHLTIDYCRRPAQILAKGWPYWTWIFPAACAFALVQLRSKALWAAAAVFVAALLPVLGLLRFRFQTISTVADRYLYVAMLGPAIVVSYALGRWGRTGFFLTAVVVILLAGRSFVAADVWRDSVTLYRNAIAIHPESVMAQNNLGSVYQMQGRTEDAIRQWRIALSLQPDLLEARENLKDALAQRASGP